MRYGKRLSAIVGMADETHTIADIGCDHGFVAARLLLEGKAQRVIAADISEDSLKKAQALKNRLKLDGMHTRLGDGLSVLKIGEANAAILAGMGGPLMCEIIDRHLSVAQAMDYLILSPNRYADKLRLRLSDGFAISDETLVCEGKRFYPIIKAIPGNRAQYTGAELILGPVLLKNKSELLLEYVKYHIKRLQNIMLSLKNAGKPFEETLALINELQEVEKCL